MTTKLKLVARAKKGDAEAFQALIHEEKGKLYKIAFVYMRNEDDALEVFQETPGPYDISGIPSSGFFRQ